MIPIPSHVSEFNDRRLIIYNCPKCKGSLEAYGKLAFKCPHCNIPLEWDGIPTYCTPEFREEYESILDADEKRFKKKSREATLLDALQSFVSGTNEIITKDTCFNDAPKNI